MIEPERPSVLNALARIERCDRAAQHVGSDAEATCADLQLEVNSGSWTERARPLDERATRAQIDEGHRITRRRIACVPPMASWPNRVSARRSTNG